MLDRPRLSAVPPQVRASPRTVQLRQLVELADGESFLATPSRMSDTDGPVIGDRPAWVVRDFPNVTIRVGEGPGHASPLGACRRPHDLPAGPLSLGKYCRDLFGGSNILRQFDAGCAVPPECCPEPQDHAASLEEADLLVRLLSAVPAHRLIKGSGTGQIGDAKGYQTDSLLHLASIAVHNNVQERCCQVCTGLRGAIRYVEI